MSNEVTTVTGDHFTASSTTETAEQLRESLAEPDPISEAASELGKASAAKRAEQVEEGPQEPASGDEPAVSGSEPERLGKPRHDPKARMLEATRKESEAKKEAAALRAERDALKAERDALKVPKTEPAPAKVEAPGKPKADDFATYEEFVEALADYKAEQRFKIRDEETAFQSAVHEYKTQIDKEMGEVVSGYKEYEKADPTWFDRLSEEVKQLRTQPSFIKLRDAQGNFVEPLTPDNVICDEAYRSKADGPRLLLYLSDHPDELQRLRSLESRIDLQAEMRFLAKTLTGAVTAGAAPRGEISRARPPVRPVTGASNTVDKVPGDEVPYEEHRRYWNAKEARR